MSVFCGYFMITVAKTTSPLSGEWILLRYITLCWEKYKILLHKNFTPSLQSHSHILMFVVNINCTQRCEHLLYVPILLKDHFVCLGQLYLNKGILKNWAKCCTLYITNCRIVKTRQQQTYSRWNGLHTPIHTHTHTHTHIHTHANKQTNRL